MEKSPKHGARYGARVYAYSDGVALIKQTIKSGPGYTDDYVVDTRGGDQHEKHVYLSDDKAVAEAIRKALEGLL